MMMVVVLKMRIRTMVIMFRGFLSLGLSSFFGVNTEFVHVTLVDLLTALLHQRGGVSATEISRGSCCAWSWRKSSRV